MGWSKVKSGSDLRNLDRVKFRYKSFSLFPYTWGKWEESKGVIVKLHMKHSYEEKSYFITFLDGKQMFVADFEVWQEDAKKCDHDSVRIGICHTNQRFGCSKCFSYLYTDESTIESEGVYRFHKRTNITPEGKEFLDSIDEKVKKAYSHFDQLDSFCFSIDKNELSVGYNYSGLHELPGRRFYKGKNIEENMKKENIEKTEKAEEIKERSICSDEFKNNYRGGLKIGNYLVRAESFSTDPMELYVQQDTNRACTDFINAMQISLRGAFKDGYFNALLTMLCRLEYLEKVKSYYEIVDIDGMAEKFTQEQSDRIAAQSRLKSASERVEKHEARIKDLEQSLLKESTSRICAEKDIRVYKKTISELEERVQGLGKTLENATCFQNGLMAGADSNVQKIKIQEKEITGLNVQVNELRGKLKEVRSFVEFFNGKNETERLEHIKVAQEEIIRTTRYELSESNRVKNSHLQEIKALQAKLQKFKDERDFRLEQVRELKSALETSKANYINTGIAYDEDQIKIKNLEAQLEAQVKMISCNFTECNKQRDRADELEEKLKELKGLKIEELRRSFEATDYHRMINTIANL